MKCKYIIQNLKRKESIIKTCYMFLLYGDIMNDFKDSLVFSVSEEKAKNNMIDKYYNHYLNFYQDEKIQEYLHNIIATILLTYHTRYEGFNVEIPYRFKAPHSIHNKLIENSEELGNSFGPIKPLKDAFAMKIVSYSHPPIFHSEDPEIMGLITEKQNNYEFLAEMQKFKSSLLKNEFESPLEYNYSCTKYEYFSNCKKILEKIISLVHPDSKNLINHYTSLMASIDESLEFIEATDDANSTIDDDDLTNKKINFFDILDDFSARIPDKLDLTLLTKQVSSLFNNNPIFDALSISSSNNIKIKRTENGYVSNFIYINTLIGPIECQLQSLHEYEQGNFGFPAHTNLSGKSIKPLPLPSENDKKSIKNFVSQVQDIAPKAFVARIDSTEKNRVITQQFSDYQNYKNVTSQVTKGDPLEKYLFNYFAKLYAVKDDIFKSQEKSFGFLSYDILGYIKSENFKSLNSEVKKEDIKII